MQAEYHFGTVISCGETWALESKAKPSSAAAGEQLESHKPRIHRENPVGAEIGDDVVCGIWRREWVRRRTFSGSVADLQIFNLPRTTRQSKPRRAHYRSIPFAWNNVDCSSGSEIKTRRNAETPVGDHEGATDDKADRHHDIATVGICCHPADGRTVAPSGK